jgi:hypothetical protein
LMASDIRHMARSFCLPPNQLGYDLINYWFM